MEGKFLLAFLTALACLGLVWGSPTRRQFLSATEATASDAPAATDDEVWDDDDNDDLDLDGQNWYSQRVISPSLAPETISDYNDYDDDFAGKKRVKDSAPADIGDEDDDEDEQQDAEEVIENDVNDSEFSFTPKRDTRLMLQDDDDDQSGPIKVRHTGRNTYAKVSAGSDNSLDSAEEDNDHPFDFTIDENDQNDDDFDDDDEEDNDTKKEDRVKTPTRHQAKDDDDDDEEEDELVSEDEDNKMFEDPEDDAAQVIYGDHVFLY